MMMWRLQALDAGGEGDAGHSRGLDTASLVHRYGRSFVHSHPDVALEYYMRVSPDCLRPFMSNAIKEAASRGGEGQVAGQVCKRAPSVLRCVGVLQAAQLKGDTLEVKAQLLRELLTESNAFGYLIGSGGAGGTGGRRTAQPHSLWHAAWSFPWLAYGHHSRKISAPVGWTA